MIDLHPVDELPPKKGETGRWKTAVEAFAASTHDQVRMDIGDTPLRSAQTMTIHAIKSAKLWPRIGVTARGSELFLIRKEV